MGGRVEPLVEDRGSDTGEVRSNNWSCRPVIQ